MRACVTNSSKAVDNLILIFYFWRDFPFDGYPAHERFFSERPRPRSGSRGPYCAHRIRGGRLDTLCPRRINRSPLTLSTLPAAIAITASSKTWNGDAASQRKMFPGG